ncbi:MAG: flagellar biosynthesis protein FlhF [Planctomycetota bacterium]|nr:flagellar biosynthesis protein FlhF [Planctomycetota bacterium]
MNLKTYHAYSMAEALAAVKRDLGPDAVILNTRSFKRGGFLGLARRTVIEVTATEGAQIARKAAKPQTAGQTGRPASRAAMRAYLGSNEPDAPASLDAAETDAPSELDLLKTRRLAQAMLAQHERKRQAAESAAEPGGGASSIAPGSPPPDAAQAAPTGSSAAAPEVTAPAARHEADDVDHGEPAQRDVARRFILTPAGARRRVAGASGGTATETEEQDPAVAVLDAPTPETASEPAATGTEQEAQNMRDELLAIRSMVGEVLQRQVTSTRSAPVPTMPQALFDMYLKLIGQDLSEELADRIVNDVRAELSPAELEDEARVNDAVHRHLGEFIPAADAPAPDRPEDGRPLTIALIGPTGVGKTTTLAKLAATFKLRHGRRVGLVTADTYRIAAVDQLRTYANIIGLPLQVALTPGEMHRAMHALSACDVVLIDTAGRSQNDAGRLDELEQFLAAADPHEVHLVLSSTAGEKVLLREAEAFSVLGVDKVVLTKLDEAVSFGMLVSAVHQIGKKLSFLTTGQEVPDHIEPGRPERLAGLVLGEKVHP